MARTQKGQPELAYVIKTSDKELAITTSVWLTAVVCFLAAST